jgi:glycosyltransferase involved in cell wall biosynthesis
MDLGLFFIRRCFSKIGSAATKLGEFLACGVPVVINNGIGDSGEIVHNERVGLVLEEPVTTELDRRCSELEILLADPATPARCRRVAEKYFDLAEGIRTYDAVYRQLTREPEMDRISPFVPLELLRGSDKPTTIAS